MSEDVDFVVNCFERTYRHVLELGVVDALAAHSARSFACRTVLVNNVADADDARRRARALVAGGGADRVLFVADEVDAALARTGLTRGDLGSTPYFLDYALVAVTLPGPDWVLHWDADVRLRRPLDWVTPAIDLMRRDARVLVANPNWEDPTLPAFTSETAGPFSLGHGFSDQVFLGRRADLGRPIYGQRCLARWRYPFPASFEARVDAHLRHAGRLRATHREAVYEHPVAMGTSWPQRTGGARLAARARFAAIDALRALPWRPAHLRQL